MPVVVAVCVFFEGRYDFPLGSAHLRQSEEINDAAGTKT